MLDPKVPHVVGSPKTPCNLRAICKAATMHSRLWQVRRKRLAIYVQSTCKSQGDKLPVPSGQHDVAILIVGDVLHALVVEDRMDHRPLHRSGHV